MTKLVAMVAAVGALLTAPASAQEPVDLLAAARAHLAAHNLDSAAKHPCMTV
jgi:hypothetical protein